MELTDWFDRDTKPLHIGVYKVRPKPNGKQIVPWYSFWNGTHWGLTARTPDEAEAARHTKSEEAIRRGGFEWCGVRRKKI